MPTFDYSAANLDRIGDCHCHPSNAVRTKCRCGRVFSLGRSDEAKDALGPPVVVCACGRHHRKASGGWKGVNNGGQRDGGSGGCPGIRPTEEDKAEARRYADERRRETEAAMKQIDQRTRALRRALKRK